MLNGLFCASVQIAPVGQFFAKTLDIHAQWVYNVDIETNQSPKGKVIYYDEAGIH